MSTQAIAALGVFAALFVAWVVVPTWVKRRRQTSEEDSAN